MHSMWLIAFDAMSNTFSPRGRAPLFGPRPWHEDGPQAPKVWGPDPATPNRCGIAPPADVL